MFETSCSKPGILFYRNIDQLMLAVSRNILNCVVFVQMAGNPDQQEDNLEEQYQEEGEDEVSLSLSLALYRSLLHKNITYKVFVYLCLSSQAQEDLAVDQQQEERGEEEADPYNEENGEQVRSLILSSIQYLFPVVAPALFFTLKTSLDIDLFDRFKLFFEPLTAIHPA